MPNPFDQFDGAPAPPVGYIPGLGKTPPARTPEQTELDQIDIELKRRQLAKGDKSDEPKLNQIPPAAAAGIQENLRALRNVEGALGTLTNRPESIGPGTGMLGDTFTQFNDPEGTDVRSKVGKIGAVTIHDLSGAAVSATEAPRFQPFVPTVTDRPEVARKKLENFQKELRAAVQEQLQYYSPNNGYRAYDTPEAKAFLGGAAPPSGDVPSTGPTRVPPAPFDPEGIGSIGAFAPKEANTTPPRAEEWRRDFMSKLGTEIKTPEQIMAHAKSFGFDISPAEAKAGAEALSRGEQLDIGTPKYIPPDISGARGGTGIGEKADAVARSFADVATSGLADKVAAGANTLANGKPFRENLAREYAVSDYDTENHFTSRMIGAVAGGFALPMGEMSSIPQIARKSAGMGAAYGLGSSRTLRDVPGNVLFGAGAGAALGGGLSAAARGVGSGSRWAQGLFGKTEQELPPLVDLKTGRLNEPLQDATPAGRMAAGKEIGIDLPLDAAGDRGMAILGKGFGNLPITGGIMNDARRVTERQVTNALEDVAGRYGQASSLYTAGQAAQRGAQNWIGRFENVSSKAYEAIPISDKAPAVLDSTRATLGQLTSAFESNPRLAEAMKSTKLEQFNSALKNDGLSWRDIKDFRSRIGYEIGEQRFSDGPTKDQLRALYAGLSEDMKATAASQGPKAIRAFERANNLYAQGQQRIEKALVTILGDDAMKNPEAAAAAIQRIAQSGKGTGNIEQLRAIRSSMAKGGEWDDVAASMIRLMGQPRNAEGRQFSPQTFIDGYANMTEEARNIMFGDRGRGELRGALDKFIAVNQRVAGTNALRNTSNTVPNIMGGAMVGTVSGTAVAGLTNPLLVVGAAGVGGVNYGLGKLWTSPTFVNWATGYSKALARGADPAVMKVQMGRLQQIAVKNPALREPVATLLQRLTSAANDNASTVTRSAAGTNSQDEQ